MRVSLRNRPTRPGLRRRGGEPAPAASAPGQAPAPKAVAAPDDIRATLTTRAKRDRAEGGPQDQALYRCGCGAAFKSPVTASVSCPHCGSGQAW
jgi:hypothetical protein